MIQEQWNAWDIGLQIHEECRFGGVRDDVNGFRLAVFIPSRSEYLKMIFKNTIQAHRVTDKEYRAKKVMMLKDPVCNLFFCIDNSSYLEWITKESYGSYENLKFAHFAIVTEEKIIDIISAGEPEIEFECYDA